MTAGGRIRRFFDVAAAEERDGEWRVLLDGREAKTRGGNGLAAPTRRLAEAVAAEWEAGGEWIDTARMPFTKFAWTAIDLGPAESGRWRALVQNYLGADLLCHRAERPPSLVERQSAEWDPFLAWARRAFGAELVVSAGVARLDQTMEAVQQVAGALEGMDAWRLVALKSAVEITGSAVLAMALEAGAFPAAQIFAASRLDERYQAEQWGVDAEAAARERALETAFEAANRWLQLLES